MATSQSAFDWAKSILSQWGMQTLAPQLSKFVQDGMTSDQLSFALRDTQEYKQRFPANAERAAKGLPELTPAQYIATEAQYHQIAQQYGLPAGFYDSHSDFSKFIAGDVSPTEFEQRVKVAADTWVNGDPATKQAWKQLYGLDDGHGIAATLDMNTALPLLQQHAQAAGIAGAAIGQGVQAPTRSRAEQFAQFGVTLPQAQAAYSSIAQQLPDAVAASSRFGEDVGQSTLENATLLNNGDAQRSVARVAASEDAMFHGAPTSGKDSATVDNGSY